MVPQKAFPVLGGDSRAFAQHEIGGRMTFAEKNLSPECEEIISEIVRDPQAWLLDLFWMALTLAGIVYGFSAWGAAQ